MVIVKTKSELISAIKNGETDIVVANPALAKACSLVEENSYSHEQRNARLVAEAISRHTLNTSVSNGLFEKVVVGLSSLFMRSVSILKGASSFERDATFHKVHTTEAEDISILLTSNDIAKALKGKTIKIKQKKGKYIVNVN